jgi:hypothetical protein
MQRVLLARALLGGPQVLVLDEPTQGLDQPGEAAFYRLIEEVRADTGCAVLMVSHDLHVVMAASDRVICLNGHVCCEGAPHLVSRRRNIARCSAWAPRGRWRCTGMTTTTTTPRRMTITTIITTGTTMLDDFLVRAALAGVGLALATGPLGSFVVWRRMAYFGDATAHAAVLGVALALATDLPIQAGTLVVARRWRLRWRAWRRAAGRWIPRWGCWRIRRWPSAWWRSATFRPCAPTCRPIFSATSWRSRAVIWG